MKREELEQAVKSYLSNGGDITKIKLDGVTNLMSQITTQILEEYKKEFDDKFRKYINDRISTLVKSNVKKQVEVCFSDIKRNSYDQDTITFLGNTLTSFPVDDLDDVLNAMRVVLVVDPDTGNKTIVNLNIHEPNPWQVKFKIKLDLKVNGIKKLKFYTKK